MNTKTPVKNTFTVSIKTSLTPHLFKEIYLSFYANTLASKASLRAGVAYVDGSETDLVASDLLEISSFLLKTESDFQIVDVKTLEQFCDFIQSEVADFVQTNAAVQPFGHNTLRKELAQCQDIALQECRFIIGQPRESYESFFELSELARNVISRGEPRSLLSIWTHLLTARTFLLSAVELFTEVLEEIKNNIKSGREENYRKFRDFASLIWVANSFYDIVPEEEINSLESLDGYLEAIRFQFPVLDCESTEKDEHCIELLEQCLSEARVAGLRALQMA